MEYFIADLHFGHANILKLCNRAYDTVKEMDDALIAAWNKQVTSKKDVVYIVGDFVWEKADPTPYLERLNGRKVLVTGNHDKKWLRNVDCTQYFEEITPYLEIRAAEHEITLCHYPMLEWNASRKIGSKKVGFLIHGHVHNRQRDYDRNLFLTPHALNAGVDINGFQPVTFAELEANNERYKLSKLSAPLDRAQFLASKYHLYQADKAGKPYIEHPRAVAAGVEREEEKIVAYLHDIVEDTDISVALLRQQFSEEVVEAVLAMTHRENEGYFDYLERVAKNPIARVVKQSDLRHNMDLSRLKEVAPADLERVEKYKKAFAILSNYNQ